MRRNICADPASPLLAVEKPEPSPSLGNRAVSHLAEARELQRTAWRQEFIAAEGITPEEAGVNYTPNNRDTLQLAVMMAVLEHLEATR